MNTIEKLDRLSYFQDQMDALIRNYDELRNSIIPADIKTQLDEMEVEYKTQADNIQKAIAELTNEIKFEVLSVKATVKGSQLVAVWNKGRVSWDSKGLEGYLVANPEISAFKSVGEPTVTIRKV